jgi:hypothetical protein
MSAVKGKARVVEIADQESESEPETDLDDYESSSDSPPSDDRSECILPLEEPGVGTSTSYNRNPTGNKLKNRRTHFLFNFFSLLLYHNHFLYYDSAISLSLCLYVSANG